MIRTHPHAAGEPESIQVIHKQEYSLSKAESFFRRKTKYYINWILHEKRAGKPQISNGAVT